MYSICHIPIQGRSGRALLLINFVLWLLSLLLLPAMSGCNRPSTSQAAGSPGQEQSGTMLLTPAIDRSEHGRGKEGESRLARNQSNEPRSGQPRSKPEEEWGIEIVAIRLTSAGYMIDFRFRVLDPEKAAALLDRRTKPYLIDEASGNKFLVPTTPKVGALRQTTSKPEMNRIYYMFFANPGKFIKPGNKISVVIGDFKAEKLTVQ